MKKAKEQQDKIKKSIESENKKRKLKAEKGYFFAPETVANRKDQD